MKRAAETTLNLDRCASKARAALGMDEALKAITNQALAIQQTALEALLDLLTEQKHCLQFFELGGVLAIEKLLDNSSNGAISAAAIKLLWHLRDYQVIRKTSLVKGILGEALHGSIEVKQHIAELLSVISRDAACATLLKNTITIVLLQNWLS